MRYMMFIKHSEDYKQEEVPAALHEAMGKFIEEKASKGVFIDGAGLKPLIHASRVRLSGGKLTVTDGPFTEAKEVVGGYALCEFKSHQEAVEMAKEFMDLHRIHWPQFEGESEIRPLEGS